MTDRVRRQIMRMHENDLAVREPLIEAMREGEGGMIGFFERAEAAVFAELERVDAENSALAMAILDQVGWPTEAVVGTEAAEAWAHLIAQRVSKEALDYALPHLRAAAEAGDVAAVTVAQMEDRAEVLNGRPQRYGTQWTQSPGMGYLPHPLDDEAEVEVRRAQLGLVSLAEYRRQMEETFGTP